MALTPTSQLAHSTVRIECQYQGGAMGTGTGFFYGVDREGDQYKPVIVTNWHVVEGAERGKFLFTHAMRKGSLMQAITRQSNSISSKAAGCAILTQTLTYA